MKTSYLKSYNLNSISCVSPDLRLLIANNHVAQEVKNVGYTYIQLLSGYLLPSLLADVNRDFSKNGIIDVIITSNSFSQNTRYNSDDNLHHRNLDHFYKSSFIPIFVDTTLLRIVNDNIEQLYKDDNTPYGLFDPNRFLDTLDEVKEVAKNPKATFTFVHLLKPHKPVTFNAAGEIISSIDNPTHDEYFAEFGFANSKFLETIDAILENSETPPIIIFQADHGSTYGQSRPLPERRLVSFDRICCILFPRTI